MNRSGNRFCLLLAGLMLSPCAMAADPATTGLFTDVVFQQYSDLSSSQQLAARLLSPLHAARLQRQAASGAIQAQPVTLERERFALYVPAKEPPEGYALLVFVPPWDEAKVPPRWTGVLERRGIILVTAAHSGNDADPLDRREPLALLAAVNVMARYHVNPRRVYVGGFSGGSRVALRLAVGYPDLFHGALLDAGSDPIGDTIPPPQGALLNLLQTSTRLVYLTGQQDSDHLDMDQKSRHSLSKWCITDVDTVNMPWLGHELANPASLERALVSLDQHHSPDPDTLQRCRTRIEQALDAQLAQATQWMQNGKTDDAQRLLLSIDAHYGGLAQSRIWQIELSPSRKPTPNPPAGISSPPSPSLDSQPAPQATPEQHAHAADI